MYERADFETESETVHTSEEHAPHCACRECDPDFYFDPAERFAGERSERW
jgi:hypothetical protein